MKLQSYIKLLPFLSFALFVMACDGNGIPVSMSAFEEIGEEIKEPSLTVSREEVNLSAYGGTETVNVTATDSWYILFTSDWLRVSPLSGQGNGVISLTASENKLTKKNEGEITIVMGGKRAKISVKQDAREPSPSSSDKLTVSVANGISLNMIRVDGGTFTMGATSEQGSDAHSDESPTHSVTLSSYYIGETEVTQELWQAVMGSNPSEFSGSKRPVEQVSWNDCQEFIRKLNALTGKTFRLPTEAEWEFAARGGTKSKGYKYAGSNTIGDVAWYTMNSYDLGSSSPDYGTHAVATKAPNELGLYDMSGNVYEWCADWYGSYSSSAQTNPTGPSSGSDRVLRGGSWFLSARRCRVSYRSGCSPDFRLDFLGLRLAL